MLTINYNANKTTSDKSWLHDRSLQLTLSDHCVRQPSCDVMTPSYHVTESSAAMPARRLANIYCFTIDAVHALVTAVLLSCSLLSMQHAWSRNSSGIWTIKVSSGG